MDRNGSEGFSGNAPEDGALFDGVPLEERRASKEPLESKLDIETLHAVIDRFNSVLGSFQLDEIVGIIPLGDGSAHSDEELEQIRLSNSRFETRAYGRIEAMRNMRDELIELLEEAESV